MAAGGNAAPVTNGTHAFSKPIELAIGLPHRLGTRIHLHLTILASSVMLFLTSASMDAGQAGAAMGSFVYAMPDVSHFKGPQLNKALTCFRDTILASL